MLLLPACTLACGRMAPGTTPATERGRLTIPAPAQRRAILVSFDSFNEQRAVETVDAAAIPAIRTLFDSASCAEYARPAFPSITAAGHAALWTGAYGDITGISANTQPRLPRDRHSLTEWISGFSSEALRAEPIWISAAFSGRVIVGHQVTQAPGPPGFPAVSGEPDSALLAARERAEQALARANVHVVNGYNTHVAPDLTITERTARPRPASGWRRLERLDARGRPPLEIAWKVGEDSLHALLYGGDRYTHMLVAPSRDASRGVVATAAPVESAPFAGRELARHFSEPLEIRARCPGRTGECGRAFVRVRLFTLAPDASTFLFFQPALDVVEANRPEVQAAYDAATRGWVGNGASRLLSDGHFGQPLWQGGDGTAEARYLETLEHLTRQFMRGVEWAWNDRRASLLLDYFPLIDEIEHDLYGFVSPATPHHDPALARRIQAVRQRAWMLADMRMSQLLRFAAAEPGVALFVSGDHGMRPTWRVFRPNVALKRAGLLATDSAGRIDLFRTRALSPNGYWVSVNHMGWKNGIVPPAAVPEVLAAAERALLAARGADGNRVVTRLWRPTDHDSLGIGGPVGGDLYYSVAEGYRWTRDTRGPITADGPPQGNHGFPPTERDMYTVFCAYGPAFPPRRIPAVRTIDAAPTVAEWLGVEGPAAAAGKSVLAELRGEAALRTP
ncbi:MAG: alkaline phosphatase family protein [Gemmatimonadaceae bacterium]